MLYDMIYDISDIFLQKHLLLQQLLVKFLRLLVNCTYFKQNVQKNLKTRFKKFYVMEVKRILTAII